MVKKIAKQVERMLYFIVDNREIIGKYLLNKLKTQKAKGKSSTKKSHLLNNSLIHQSVNSLTNK